MPTTDQGPAPIRVHLSLVIDMTGDQVAAYAAEYGLPHHDGPLRAKDIVNDVRSYVLTAIQDSAAFGEIGRGDGTRGATVTIKGG